MEPPNDKVLLPADMAGIFLFAIEGATAAIQNGLDLLGLIGLAFSVAIHARSADWRSTPCRVA
jgi:uncharacterized membrane protein YeiH